MKTLILYVFHQDCANLDTFIKRGLIDSEDITFIFICNNLNPDLVKWNFINKYRNVHLFIRPNVGHDFQGWNEALFLPLSSLENKIIKSKKTESKGEIQEQRIHTVFDRFICINSTAVGPYLPSYVDRNWVECFSSKLSQEVKMVGISVNFLWGQYNQYMSDIIKINYGFDCREYAHVQSMAYALDREGMDILLRYGLFKEGKEFPKNKWELICSSEIGMSAILRHERKSIYAYFMHQGLIKYNEVANSGDLWDAPGLYPVCETIFSKTNYLHSPKEQSRYDNIIS